MQSGRRRRRPRRSLRDSSNHPDVALFGILFNELFKRHRFAGLVDLRAGSAREVDGGDGDVLFEHTAAQHLAGDDDRLVFLSVPFDAAQVDLSVRAPWLLQSGGDVLPYVGTGIARDRLQIGDEVL